MEGGSCVFGGQRSIQLSYGCLAMLRLLAYRVRADKSWLANNIIFRTERFIALLALRGRGASPPCWVAAEDCERPRKINRKAGGGTWVWLDDIVPGSGGHY
jgi:hypothetical protein